APACREGWTLEGYAAGWREVQLLGEGEQPGGRVAGWYLRVPYAVGGPLARGGVDPDLVTLGGLGGALVGGGRGALWRGRGRWWRGPPTRSMGRWRCCRGGPAPSGSCGTRPRTGWPTWP